MTNTTKYNAIYIRVSVLKEESVSPEMQLEKAKQYCQLTNEPYQVFQDLDFSGKDTNRPAFQQMLEQIRAGLINKVVVYRLDRISRSLKDLTLLIDELQQRNVELYSVTERFDTTSPMGRAMLNIMGVFAQMEREVIAQRIQDTASKLISDGVRLGHSPFGYRLKVKSHSQWEIVPNETQIVKKVYELYATGKHSYKSLAKYLNQTHPRLKREIPPGYGKSNWGRGQYAKYGWQEWTIKAILANPTYAGIITEDAQLPAKNFQPIIPLELYLQCQSIRQKRTVSHPYYQHNTTHDYPLKRKVFCFCGGNMYNTNRIKEKKKNGLNDSSDSNDSNSSKSSDRPYTLFYWCHNARYGSKAPGQKSESEVAKHHNFVKAQIIWDEILEYLKTCKIDQNIIQQAKNKMLGLGPNSKSISDQQAERAKRIKYLQESYQRLLELFIDGEISKIIFQQKASKIKSEIQALQPMPTNYTKKMIIQNLPQILSALENLEKIDSNKLDKLDESNKSDSLSASSASSASKYLHMALDLFVEKVVLNGYYIQTLKIYKEFEPFFEKPYYPKKFVSSSELVKICANIYQSEVENDKKIFGHNIRHWNKLGILPDYGQRVGMGKLYLLDDSLRRISIIQHMRKDSYSYTQIKAKLEGKPMLISIPRIAKSYTASDDLISHRLAVLLKPKLIKGKKRVAYYDFEEVKEVLKGKTTPYEFMGKDLRRYKIVLDQNTKEGKLTPISRRVGPRVINKALAKVGGIEAFGKKLGSENNPFVSTSILNKILGISPDTARYWFNRFKLTPIDSRIVHYGLSMEYLYDAKQFITLLRQFS